MDDPNGVDDRAQAHYLFDVGGDWWRSLTADRNGLGVNNDEFGFSQYKYVTHAWQTVTFTNVSPGDLARYPSALVCAQGTAPLLAPVNLRVAQQQ